MKPFFIVLILFLSPFSYGKGVDFTTKKPSTKEFSLKKACEEMGYNHVLLAIASSQSTVDCMGKKLRANSFCKSKFGADPRFLRGFVRTDVKTVICHFAESAILTIPCGHFKDVCKRPDFGCRELKARYAINHEVIHSSVSGRAGGDSLRCYYSVKSDIDKNL